MQDVIIGAGCPGSSTGSGRLHRYLVVLSPTVSALEWRERQRAKDGYLHFSPGVLDEVLRRETAQIG